MITASLEISPALRAKLTTLAGMLSGDAVNAPLILAGNVIANSAKSKVPVLSGTLRRSIRVEVLGVGDVVVGSDVAYARRIEYGFNASDSRGRRYHQAAQPYLRPAFDENRAAARDAVVKGMQDVMRRALG